ncbi:MAG: hypothetical protein QG639_97 [Patescibacteria group bacterium]|jgi:mannitol-specific phosphotransferase system IIBC component|nr:hypothetical protein [Patescibacteria group bacterium]
MSIFYKNIVRSFVIALMLVQLVMPATAFAQAEWSDVCVGEELGEDRGGDVATIQGAQCLIANAFSVIITVIGLAGFVMFIFGAFQWMISGTNPKGADTARQSMTYAVIGIVVALCGFIIINLLAEFTGVDMIRTFVIPSDETPAPGGGGGGFD